MRRDWEVTEVVGEVTSEERLGGDRGCGERWEPVRIDWKLTEVVEEVTNEERLGGDRGCGRGDQ